MSWLPVELDVRHDYCVGMSGIAGLLDADDAELWKRILSGDRDAFECWHPRYNPRLMPFLRTRCRPPLDADDVAQDVWLRVWPRRHLWNPAEGRFEAWLFQLAKNVCFDLLRKLQRRPEQALSETTDPVARPATMARSDLQALSECLQLLGGPFVEILRLRIEAGLSDHELADRLGIAVGTVSSRVSRGKSEVRQCVERRLA